MFRLLVISPWYPNRVHPTDGNFVAKLVQLFEEEPSIEITVLSVVAEPRQVTSSPEVVPRAEEGAQVVRVYYAGGGARVQRIWARSRAWRTGLDYVGTNFDLIHAHVLIDGGIAAEQHGRRFGIPFVVTEHATRYYQPWPKFRLPELWLARRAARRAVWLLPVTSSLERALQQHGIDGRTQVISNVVDDRLFYPPPTLIESSEFRLLHVSDFGPRKRIALLLEAFYNLEPRCPNLRLTIAGDGDLKQLARQILSLDPLQRPFDAAHPIEISGPHSPEEIGNLMRRADAFVLTSALETQSVVTLEALLCGLPVVSTRCGGPETILTDEELGLLTPVDDHAALTVAVATLYEAGRRTPVARSRVADRVRRRYGSKAIRTRLFELYRSVANA